MRITPANKGSPGETKRRRREDILGWRRLSVIIRRTMDVLAFVRQLDWLFRHPGFCLFLLLSLVHPDRDSFLLHRFRPVCRLDDRVAMSAMR